MDAVRVLTWLADDLERRGYPFAPALRQVARQLAEAGVSPVDDTDGCAKCGGGVVQPPTGRRRRYCVTCSPRKTHGKRSNAA